MENANYKNNENLLVAQISNILVKLGYNNSNLNAVSYKIAQEIWDKTLLKCLDITKQEELKEMLFRGNDEEVVKIVTTIPAPLLDTELKQSTLLVFKDILDKLSNNIPEENWEEYENLLGEINISVQRDLNFSDKSPNEILEILSNK